ncbi:MAG: hypothetical protein PWQ28_609 [Candidatus Woesearchaeota archaeon]|nr:hypothetical protein [Candidatus Woesearchaeota archaeon]MDK2907969.1 hypothetical protein [Candidatus Woesearchaeota archaeon]
MTEKSFYVDACIYLNLWKKEGDETKGVPYWKIAKDFLKKIDDNNITIYYSGFLLKEIKYVIGDKLFNEKRRLFDSSPNFKKINISSKELNEVRKIESESNFEISFFDIIHMILSRKTNSILITRDEKLLELSKKYSVEAHRPENFL